MSNFKSGSGNLDFGGSDDDDSEKDETANETTEGHEKGDGEAESAATEQASPEETTPETEDSSDQSTPDQSSSQASDRTEKYPYFIRRSNVGDERDTRLEIHVREKVAEQEPKFRNELAEKLGASEISKTDAREFALLAAFQNPDRVAELMRKEGFGALN